MAISRIQVTGNHSTSRVNSLSKAFASGVTAGNFIGVAYSNYDVAIGTTDVTDSLSNTYTRNVSKAQVAPYRGTSVWSAPNITGGACTITVTKANSWITFGMGEYSGVATTSPLDVTATGTATSTAPTTGNLVCADADLIIGCMSWQTGGVTSGQGTNYTVMYKQDSGSYNQANTEDRILSSSGTYAADWTLSSSVLWACCAAAYKPAAGGGGGLSIPVLMQNMRGGFSPISGHGGFING